MASTYTYYTQTTPTDNNKWTLSMWLKRGTLGTVENLVGAWADGSNHTVVRFNADDQLDWYDYQAPASFQLKTNRKFKDVGAWYHLVLVWDSDNGTSGDRMKTWVNGVRETSFATADYPTSSASTVINVSGRVMEIGRRSDGGYFTGEMSHVQFVDGLALAPTEFGETDATSGIWKIKTGSYATAGTNGFHLKMEDTSNLDLDSSSNAHTFTTSGNLIPTKDNPSNNFCTMNPLDNYWQGSTFSEGNNTVTTTNAATTYNTSTFGMTTGKWYWEAKITDVGATSNFFGISGKVSTSATDFFGNDAYDWGTRDSTGKFWNNSSSSTYGATWTSNDTILGIALDLDNNKFYSHVNGTWNDSGNPVTGTGAKTITAASLVPAGAYFASFGDWNTGDTITMKFNFGNGYFGTTAITTNSGAGYADDAGEGKMNYDVPAGYYVLNTKNIKTYG